MEALNALVTLDYVTKSIIHVMRADERDYIHLKQLVIDGYSELCMYHLNNVKVVYLDIEDGNIVTLPADYMYYSKIGVLINGKVHTLTRDDTIALPRDMECGQDVEIPTVVQDSTVITDPYLLQRELTRSDGAYFADRGGKNLGYYRVDEEKRVIQLRGLRGFQGIVLEYANVPINIGEETMIVRYAVPALKAYVLLKVVEYDTRVRDNEKARREFAYSKELYNLRMVENQLTADEYMDIVNATRTGSTRR